MGLWTIPDIGGEVRALRKPGSRFIEVAPGDDPMLSDHAWQVLTAPADEVFDEYRDLLMRQLWRVRSAARRMGAPRAADSRVGGQAPSFRLQ